jgi:hypothetical protein
MNKELYILSPKMKWRTFKLLQKKLVKDDGPTPIHGDKAIWNLLKEKRIYCWFAEDMKNDMGLGLEIPKRYEKWKKNIII